MLAHVYTLSLMLYPAKEYSENILDKENAFFKVMFIFILSFCAQPFFVVVEEWGLLYEHFEFT